MNGGWRLGCLKTNLTVSLLIEVLITCFGDKAVAYGLPGPEIPPAEFEIVTPINNSTTSTVIMSQVPNPNPVPPIQQQPIPTQPQVPNINPILPTPPPPQPIPTPQPLPEPPNITPSTPTPTEPRPDIPGTIKVERFEFEGNTAFSDEKLREVTAEFTTVPITFSRLLEVEAKITKLYTDAGYINSGAVIAAGQEFSPEGAVIKVQIIEGTIEEIRVTGTRRLSPDYVRNRIRLGVSKPLNRNRLLEALQVLQINPLIKNLSTELSAGSSPEKSLLQVNVKEANSFSTEFFIDNARAPSVGSFRRGVRITEGNLFGIGDRFGATYINTDGSNALDLSYSVPVNPRNGTITLAGGFTNTTIVEPPFDRIDITGDSFYLDLSYRQPVIQTPTQELALGVSVSRQQSQTKLLGENYRLSPGANEQGETRISAVRFFQDYTQRSPRQVLALRSQFSLGVGLFDATVNSQPPDSRFFSWRGQGQYIRVLAPETLLVFRSDLQLSTRALVPLEQFSLGGLQSVRGYRQDLYLIDNGFFASAEVRFPLLRVQQVKGVLQVAPFVDLGVGWNSSGYRNPNRNTLVGIGVGLQWQMNNKFTARVDYGVPLVDVNSGDRTLQEQGFYFSVNFSPF